MKKLLLLLFGASCINTYGQITLHSADFPQANDLYVVSEAGEFPGMDATLTGANYTWDFSMLSATTTGQRTDTIFDVSNMNIVYTVVFGDFSFAPHRSNQSTHGMDFNLTQITITDVYNFYYNNSDDYHQSGFGAEVNGVPVPTPFTPHDIIYNYPVEFGNLDSSASGYEVSLPNLLYYGVNKNRINEVDGWGTLITPSGTYNVLRLKSTIYEHDSVFLDTLGFGYGFDVPTQIEYKWLGQGEGIPLLQINEVGGTVASVVYKGVNATGIVSAEKKDVDLKVYPNPATDKLFLDFTLEKSMNVTVVITDIQGNIVRSIDRQMENTGRQRMMMDLPPDLEAGNYFVKLNAGSLQTVQAFVKAK